LQPELERHISENVGTIDTDGHPIYVFALNRKFAGKQKTIDHNKAYAIGDVHTNTIESAFSLFKRGLYATFHQVSTKHLGRYCDEFSYRSIAGDSNRNCSRRPLKRYWMASV
jgi:hypothetical protein